MVGFLVAVGVRAYVHCGRCSVLVLVLVLVSMLMLVLVLMLLVVLVLLLLVLMLPFDLVFVCLRGVGVVLSAHS